MKANSTTRPKRRKVLRLTKHPRGYWCKKVNKKTYYFGRIADDPTGEAALERWLADEDALRAGRVPNRQTGGLTLKALCERFMAAKDLKLQSGEIKRRTFDELYLTCESTMRHLGAQRPVDDLMPADFESLLASMGKLGVYRKANEIQRVRSIFKYGFESGLLDKPMRFGPEFKRPTRKTFRLHRASKPKKLFAAAELRLLIDKAPRSLKAMILLAINGGMGNTDCGLLEFRNVDLEAGWLDYPRPKTGVARRIPLWPETVAALKICIERRTRPRATGLEQRVFITKQGKSWSRITKTSFDCHVSKAFRKVLDSLGLHRDGRGFYSIRHTFRTVADSMKDFPAIDHLMGHANDEKDMSDRYREQIDDARLQAVVDYVREWLFKPDAQADTKPASAKRASSKTRATSKRTAKGNRRSK